MHDHIEYISIIKTKLIEERLLLKVWNYPWPIYIYIYIYTFFLSDFAKVSHCKHRQRPCR